MGARLGKVIYWLGCILAAVILALDAAVWIEEGRNEPDGLSLLIFFAVVALIVWAIGWAARYVLSGT